MSTRERDRSIRPRKGGAELLADLVGTRAEEFGIPGAAAGVWMDGREIVTGHGVTSIDNPLPVDEDTLFQLASISKTYTATALMRLVAQGRVELDAPVRRYLPELRLTDERAAEEVTVMNLLNHTAGLDWGLIADIGEGDDALAGYVSRLAGFEMIAEPGVRASYSQAGFNLAGRLIEKVTGETFERAVAALLFEPLGLAHSFYARDDVMTRRFVVGHNLGEDGKLSVARMWRRSRGDNPGGGIASSISDQLRWARFHLGDGRAESGERILPTELLAGMRRPTVALRGSSLGDSIGIAWFLRDVAGVRTASHGGSANGQFAELLLVPDRGFAVVSLANQGPGGIPFNQAVLRGALEAFLGLVDREPEPIAFDAARAEEIAGAYANEAMTFLITTDGTALTLSVRVRPEIRAAAEKDIPPDPAPAAFGLLPGDRDEYVITDGAYAGQKGYFSRDASGAVIGVDLAGRLFGRVG